MGGEYKTGRYIQTQLKSQEKLSGAYESIATVGEIRVWWRADFQSGPRVLKKGVLNLFLSISLAHNVYGSTLKNLSLTFCPRFFS